MDAVDVEAITKIVKMVGAEFKGASDEDIKFWIELQAPVISRKKFGADYNLALALLTCHAMKMAGSGDNSLGTIANTGRLASVSEGGVSICLKPRELEIEAIITNSPVTWAEQHAASSSRVETMIEELRQLWLKKTPVQFTAAGDSYENMCITSITAPRTVEDGSSTRLTIKLKQASINSTDMANISVKYIRGGTSKKNTGAGQKSSSSTSGTQKDEKATKSSILCSGAKAIGLFK